MRRSRGTRGPTGAAVAGRPPCHAAVTKSDLRAAVKTILRGEDVNAAKPGPRLTPAKRRGSEDDPARRGCQCREARSAPHAREAAADRGGGAGHGGISKQDLTRKTQFIRKSFRDEYLEDLVESGELVMKSYSNGGEVYLLGR